MITFTLYPVHSTVGRGNLVLRQSLPYFPPIFLIIFFYYNQFKNFTPAIHTYMHLRPTHYAIVVQWVSF